MTKWNKLLIVLDRVLGFPNKQSSTVRKVKQDFDETTNEHIIWLEYRTRVGTTSRHQKQRLKKEKTERELLKWVNGQAKLELKKKT